MTDWFHNPSGLRAVADAFDRLAVAETRENIASAWLSKARALRSRADIVERLTTTTKGPYNG